MAGDIRPFSVLLAEMWVRDVYLSSLDDIPDLVMCELLSECPVVGKSHPLRYSRPMQLGLGAPQF